MKRILVSVLLIPTLGFSQSAEDILKKAVSYHDPQNQWPTIQATLYYTETRPTGPDRKTTFELDNANARWKLNRNDEELYQIVENNATVLKGDKDEARGLLLRNYYLYLWGLPMKLKDASTPSITKLEDEEVNGVAVDVLRVEYEKETYYFSFDQTSGQMLEYRFYKDEQARKGELIKLEDEILIKEIKIPQKRSWYTLPEMKYLGTDILSDVK